MSLTLHTTTEGTVRKPARPTWLKSSLLALVLALLVIMLLSQVWRAGLASAYFFQVQHSLTKWDNNPDQFTEQGFQQADLLMQRTLELEPDHPHYLLSMAKIQEWGWFKGFKPASSMGGVETYYQQAIALRPQWPNAYADYAWYLSTVQFRLTDALAQLALADQYGRYTPAVLHRSLAVYFSQWQHLSVVQKAQAYQVLARSITLNQRYYRPIRDLVVQYRMQRLGCIFLRKQVNSSALAEHRLQMDFCRASAVSGSN